MKLYKHNQNNSSALLSGLILLSIYFLVCSTQNVLAETVPSFPAPTTVDQKKAPTSISPMETREDNNKLNDPQALDAIRTLIQGGIPVGQSKTQIMDNVTPISQYAGSSTSRNSDLNAAYRYVVKKGDTLNKIIKDTFNQHPLKMKEIGKAIIATNKRAFPTGKPNSMQAGATLIIPSVLALTADKVNLKGNLQSNGVEMKSRQNPYVSTDPHRGWVRFP